MALPSGTYAPRDPAASVLYQVVRDHYRTFRAEAAGVRDGEGLPRFVDDEFDAFLRSGWLAGGFARFRCTSCREERLVAFSCKGRGFCPSCGGRRMTERAAHLVDHVWPEVPVRQWVLTLPPRIRHVLAWRHDLCTAVAGALRLVALLEAGTVTARILRHLGLPSEVPAARPARAPPSRAATCPGERSSSRPQLSSVLPAWRAHPCTARALVCGSAGGLSRQLWRAPSPGHRTGNAGGHPRCGGANLWRISGESLANQSGKVR